MGHIPSPIIYYKLLLITAVNNMEQGTKCLPKTMEKRNLWVKSHNPQPMNWLLTANELINFNNTVKPVLNKKKKLVPRIWSEN